jgi:hypothetical protein
VIQASRLGELVHATVRTERFSVESDRTVAAEQAPRGAAGGRPAGAQRHFLGLADRCAVAGFAERVLPANDPLQPLCAVA